MNEIIWSSQALSNLQAIKEYISHDSENYAQSFVERIFSEVERVSLFPSSGRKVPEANLDFVREIFVNDYRVVYSIIENKVNVITIHHGARKLKQFE